MDRIDYQQRQYNPSHPHSAAAAAAQARLRQRSSFDPVSSRQDSAAWDPAVRQPASPGQRSNTFGTFFDSDPIEVASPARTSSSQRPDRVPTTRSAMASHFNQAATPNSPLQHSSPLASPNLPLASSNPLASAAAAASPLRPASQQHVESSSHTHAEPAAGGTAHLARSTSTNFGNRNGLTRPAPIRSHTGGPIGGSFSPFLEDDHMAGALASPVDAHSPQQRPTAFQHTQGPTFEGGARATPHKSSTAGPSLWGTSGLPQTTPSTASPSSSADPWRPSLANSGAFGKNIPASPLTREYKLPSREGSTSSDSDLWQRQSFAASPNSAFGRDQLRHSRRPPPRATTLATQQDFKYPTRSREGSVSHEVDALPENLQAAVAVALEPDELRQLQSSPTSAFHVDTEDGFEPASNHTAARLFTESRQTPTHMETRAVDVPPRFRAPQRATTLDPQSHLPRPQTGDGHSFHAGAPLSPVQDSISSSKQSPLRTASGDSVDASLTTGLGLPSARGDHSTNHPSDTAAVNQLALHGVFDANSAAPWNLREASPARKSQHENWRRDSQVVDQAYTSSPALSRYNDVNAFGMSHNAQSGDERHYDQTQSGSPFAVRPGVNGSRQQVRAQGNGHFPGQHQQQSFGSYATPASDDRFGAPNGAPFSAAQHVLPPQQMAGQQPPSATGYGSQEHTPEQLTAAMAALNTNAAVAGRDSTPMSHVGQRAMGTPAAQSGLYVPPMRAMHDRQASHRQHYQSHQPPQQRFQQRPTHSSQHPLPRHPNFNGAGAHAAFNRGPQDVRSNATAMAPQPSSTGPRSALLEEFRSGRVVAPGGRNSNDMYSSAAQASQDDTAHWSLDDIRGHVVEFCMDQHGSRFAQERLDSATPQQITWVFAEIRPHARTLMQDVFGNYVVQKMFEYGSELQRLSLTEEMRGHVMALSLGTYGCRVIQKALDYVPNHVRLALAEELKGHVLDLVQDQNANHVVQKLLSVVEDPDSVKFVSDAMRGRVLTLGAHCYSCRVLQRVFERCGEAQARPLLEELHTASNVLMADQYGNYVIQWILQRGDHRDKSRVIDSVAGNVLTFSRHKFASNVVEQVVRAASPIQRRVLVDEILQPLMNSSHQPHSAVLADPDITAANVMMTDQYANYVLQRFLELCDMDQKLRLVALLRPRLISLRRGAGGPGGWTKHLAAVERLVNEASSNASPSALEEAAKLNYHHNNNHHADRHTDMSPRVQANGTFSSRAGDSVDVGA